MISYNDDLLELSDLAAAEKEAHAQANQTTERIELIEVFVEKLRNESERMRDEFDGRQKEYERELAELENNFYYKSKQERLIFLDRINERFSSLKVWKAESIFF